MAHQWIGAHVLWNASQFHGWLNTCFCGEGWLKKRNHPILSSAISKRRFGMERFFKMKERGTNIRMAFIAGMMTFVSMVYILMVMTEGMDTTLTWWGRGDPTLVWSIFHVLAQNDREHMWFEYICTLKQKINRNLLEKRKYWKLFRKSCENVVKCTLITFPKAL